MVSAILRGAGVKIFIGFDDVDLVDMDTLEGWC